VTVEEAATGRRHVWRQSVLADGCKVRILLDQEPAYPIRLRGMRVRCHGVWTGMWKVRLCTWRGWSSNAYFFVNQQKCLVQYLMEGVAAWQPPHPHSTWQSQSSWRRRSSDRRHHSPWSSATPSAWRTPDVTTTGCRLRSGRRSAQTAAGPVWGGRGRVRHLALTN